MWLFILLLCGGLTMRLPAAAFPAASEDQTPPPADGDRDDAVSRKVLGSSVVTSVSVIMDTGSEKLYSDAVGKPQAKPSSGTQVASPINLLNPDRYEFYTFSDSGDLVKRLMTLSEIQGIIANADGEAFNHNSHSPEKKVNDVVSNVQSVLKSEIEKGSNYNASSNIVLDTPDVSSSWSVILPAIFGNSGEEIKPVRPQTSMTPETIMLDLDQEQEQQTVPIVKKPEPFTTVTDKSTTKKPTKRVKPRPTTEKEILKKPSTYKPSTSTYKVPGSTLKPPTTTKKPLKVATTRRVTLRSTTPTTAIPRITTRGTRPNKRTTTSTTSTTTTTVRPELDLSTESPVLQRVKHTTTSSSNVAEASSHFIQLFDPVQTVEPLRRPIVRTTPRTPSGTYSTLGTVGYPISTSSKVPEGALFIVDEKTNTRIPISTKEQLTAFLTRLETPTTEALRPLSLNSDIFKNANGSPLITLNSVSGHQTPLDSDSVGTSNDQVQVQLQVQSTTTSSDIDKYQQLLLTSTNIYEINKELAKSTSTAKPLPLTLPLVTTTTTTTTGSTSSSTNQQVSDMLSSTLKEPNLVGSIEQLIQQAVGNIQEVQNTVRTTPVPVSASTTTPIPLPTTTTATATTTTVGPTTEDSSTPNFDDLLLNEAMGSLLSQVASSDFQGGGGGLTTLQDLPSTTELELPQGENLEYRIKTTDIFSETTESTTDVPTTTTLSKTTEDATITTEADTKSTKFGSTTNEIEILKTDATTYERGSVYTSTDSTDETSTSLDSLSTEGVSDSTTELVRDLPIVFDVGLHQNFDDAETTQKATTTEVNQEKPGEESTLEKVALDGTTSKPKSKAKPTPTPTPTLKPQSIITTEKLSGGGTTSDLEDSDSLPSTNSYKEVTSNSAEVEPEVDSTTSIKEASTLSIEELIKELTTREDLTQNVPKETTVLIITKPLYSTTPTSTTTTTTTTTTEIPVTEHVPVVITSSPSPTTFTTVGGTETNTEAIALDAIGSNGDADTTEDSVTVPVTVTVPVPVTSTKEPEWTAVSTIAPHPQNTTTTNQHHNASKAGDANIKLPQPSKPVDLAAMPQLSGLEETTKHLDQDIYQFVALCNELAFGFWKSVTTGISSARSVVLSPFAATSLLAMVFLGARGATSGEMNEILRLDDMVTFNPHLIFKNVSESIEAVRNEGVATSVILRELYSDKSKGHLLNFYKERAKAFYDGHVEEVSFKEIGDTIRRRTNLIVKKQTDGKIPEYIKDSGIVVKSPLAGVSASIFQTDCSEASVEGRDGELYFVVLPSIRQRRLVPVPAAVWRSDFLAGYDPSLDATAVALGHKAQTLSTIFVIPGQQGIAAPGDGLARLERSLIGGAFKDKAWSRLLMTLIPRPGLEVQIPRFQHRSVINATVALQQMGMKDLFDAAKADLRGLNGVANDLYLSDILQVNNFATCGEAPIGDAHHSEIYPATANRTYRRSRKFKDLLPPEGAYYDSELSEEPRDYQRAFHDPLHDPSLYALPLPLRPRQARLPDPPRLRFDRPFLYFVRHNPTGLILHMGRFNPRLLP